MMMETRPVIKKRVKADRLRRVEWNSFPSSCTASSITTMRSETDETEMSQWKHFLSVIFHPVIFKVNALCELLIHVWPSVSPPHVYFGILSDIFICTSTEYYCLYSLSNVNIEGIAHSCFIYTSIPLLSIPLPFAKACEMVYSSIHQSNDIGSMKS